jgi:hypothetical protein
MQMQSTTLSHSDLTASSHSCRNSVGRDEANAVLISCIRSGLQKANVPWQAVKGICCSLSGIDTKEDVEDCKAGLVATLVQEHGKAAAKLRLLLSKFLLTLFVYLQLPSGPCYANGHPCLQRTSHGITHPPGHTMSFCTQLVGICSSMTTNCVQSHNSHPIAQLNQLRDSTVCRRHYLSATTPPASSLRAQTVQ